jgi:hypothetical protein
MSVFFSLPLPPHIQAYYENYLQLIYQHSLSRKNTLAQKYIQAMKEAQ